MPPSLHSTRDGAVSVATHSDACLPIPHGVKRPEQHQHVEREPVPDPEDRDRLERERERGPVDYQSIKAGAIDYGVTTLRKAGVTTPIILLTGQSSEADTVKGLEAGANDYVTKPFRFAVLLARIRAHLRSHEQSEDAVFRIGPYEFRPSTKVLRTKEGRRIRLTEKETEILKYLYRAGGKPVARETLLAEVWGYNAAVTTHTLETHIYRLRQKVEPDPSNAQLLLTDTGGYRLRP